MGRELIGRGPLFLGTRDPGCLPADDKPVPARVALFIFDFWLRPNDDDDTNDMVEFG